MIGPAADGYHWRETGTVTWDGHSCPAFRNQALRRQDGQWWMTFADGRPFHPWVLGEQVIHPCAPDTYRGVIDRPADDQLIITWQVDGPAKDQLIVSSLSRRRRPAPTTIDARSTRAALLGTGL